MPSLLRAGLGGQAGNSAIVRSLAGKQWFHDRLTDVHGEDASVALKCKWIIKPPDRSAMRRSDTDWSCRVFVPPHYLSTWRSKAKGLFHPNVRRCETTA
jgi:hypothetical protein